MTVTDAVLSFAVVAGLLTIIPGLDTALVLRAAISQGKRQALATALGINTGALVWGAGAAVGVSALLTASTVAYAVVRLVGAAYMVLLGVRFLRSGLRQRTGGPGSEVVTGDRETTVWASWRRGLFTNLLNPKIGAFYVAVLPQFIPAGAPHLAVGVLLALVHDVEGMLWFSAIILGAHSFRGWRGSRTSRRSVDNLTGAALIGFGMKLGLASR